jgi:hypothetical protein
VPEDQDGTTTCAGARSCQRQSNLVAPFPDLPVRNASFLKDPQPSSFSDVINLTEYRICCVRAAPPSTAKALQPGTPLWMQVFSRITCFQIISSTAGFEDCQQFRWSRNLLLKPGGGTGSNLMEGLASGLYVTEVMGQGVNLVTGDYSRGASGFAIKNGQLNHPVEEVTIAGNLRDMFLNIVAADSQLDTRGNIHAGEILLAG